jgi:hypothetical protein
MIKTIGGIGIGMALVVGSGVVFASSVPTPSNGMIPVSATFDLTSTTRGPTYSATCNDAYGDTWINQSRVNTGTQTDTSPGPHPFSLTGNLKTVSLTTIALSGPYQGFAMTTGTSILTDNSNNIIYKGHFLLVGHLIDQQMDAVARGAINVQFYTNGAPNGSHLYGNQQLYLNGTTGEVTGHFGDPDDDSSPQGDPILDSGEQLACTPT